MSVPESVTSAFDCVLHAWSAHEADRDIVQACDLDGLTVRAYAERQGLGLAAATSRPTRADARLRQPTDRPRVGAQRPRPFRGSSVFAGKQPFRQTCSIMRKHDRS